MQIWGRATRDVTPICSLLPTSLGHLVVAEQYHCIIIPLEFLTVLPLCYNYTIAYCIYISAIVRIVLLLRRRPHTLLLFVAPPHTTPKAPASYSSTFVLLLESFAPSMPPTRRTKILAVVLAIIVCTIWYLSVCADPSIHLDASSRHLTLSDADMLSSERLLIHRILQPYYSCP